MLPEYLHIFLLNNIKTKSLREDNNVIIEENNLIMINIIMSDSDHA